MDDVDLGLGELHSYDLRSLSWAYGIIEYEDNNGGEDGDREENKVGDSGEDSYEDGNFDEIGGEDDEEGDAISFTNSDEMIGQESDNDVDGIGSPEMEDEIPRLIDIGRHDDNKNQNLLQW